MPEEETMIDQQNMPWFNPAYKAARPNQKSQPPESVDVSENCASMHAYTIYVSCIIVLLVYQQLSYTFFLSAHILSHLSFFHYSSSVICCLYRLKKQIRITPFLDKALHFCPQQTAH